MVQCMVLGLEAVQKLDEVRDTNGSLLVVAFLGQELQDEQTGRLKTVDVMAETTEGETSYSTPYTYHTHTLHLPYSTCNNTPFFLNVTHTHAHTHSTCTIHLLLPPPLYIPLSPSPFHLNTITLQYIVQYHMQGECCQMYKHASFNLSRSPPSPLPSHLPSLTHR